MDKLEGGGVSWTDQLSCQTTLDVAVHTNWYFGNISKVWPLIECLFRIWDILKPTLLNFLYFCSNFHWAKWLCKCRTNNLAFWSHWTAPKSALNLKHKFLSTGSIEFVLYVWQSAVGYNGRFYAEQTGMLGFRNVNRVTELRLSISVSLDANSFLL